MRVRALSSWVAVSMSISKLAVAAEAERAPLSESPEVLAQATTTTPQPTAAPPPAAALPTTVAAPPMPERPLSTATTDTVSPGTPLNVLPPPPPPINSPNSTTAQIGIGAGKGMITSTTPVVPGWPLLVGGNFWTRFELREGYDRLGRSTGRFLEGDRTFYRTRLSFATAPIDIGHGQSVVLQFTPQADGVIGSLGSTIAIPNLGIYEGYLRLQNDTFRLDVGHFAMDYGDSLVIGNLDWHQTGRSFDGARLHIAPKSSQFFTDIFFTQLSEGITMPAANGTGGAPDTGPLAGDTYFTGIYSDIGKLLAPGLTLEPYLLGQIWASQQDVARDPTNLQAGTAQRRPAIQGTLGLRTLYDFGAIDVRFEGGAQAGKRRVGFDNPDVLAYHVDGEVGVKFLQKRLRLSLEGLFASGDKASSSNKAEGWDELFPTAHKFLGLMDIIGPRTNVASGVLHVTAKATKKLLLKLDGHVFARPETAPGQNGYAGTEVDFNALYTIGTGLTARTLYALYVPGNSHFIVAGRAREKVAHYVEVQFEYRF